MAEQAQATDMGFGLGLMFGFVAVLAALVTIVTSYVDAIGGGDFQLVAGVAIAVAMFAGGLSVAAIHAFE